MSRKVVLLMMVVGLAALWFVFRIRATPLESEEDLDRLLAEGRPVVLEFFANT